MTWPSRRRTQLLIAVAVVVASCAEPFQPVSQLESHRVSPVHSTGSPEPTDVIQAYPAPGGTTLVSEGDPGRAGGKTWHFSGINSSNFQILAWGPASGDVPKAALDGAIDAPGETLTYDPAQSNTSTGVEVWTGTSLVFLSGGGSATVQTRFTLTLPGVTAAHPLFEATNPIAQSVGLPADVGAVRGVDSPSFDANFIFEARFAGATTWTPILDFYDVLHTTGAAEQVQTSFTGAFYYRAATMSVSAASLDFGNQLVGVESAPQHVTITNDGNGDLNILSVGIVSGDAADFSAVSSPCVGTVPVHGSCDIAVTFTPTTTGARHATLRVSADKALFGPSTDIDLSGNGVQPVLSLGATAMTFPDQVIGTPSPTQSLTITNTGDGDLFISALTIDNSDFAIVGTTTCGLAAVPPSGTCSVDMVFAPHVAGIRVGTLAIASNAPGSPHHVSLSGNAIGLADLDVSMSADPNPAHAGKKLTYTITVQNHGPAAAPGVVVTDVIPSTTTFSSLSAPSGVSCTAPAVNATGTVVCSSASVANGASYTITLVVNALSGGKNSIVNTVGVSSLLTDPVPANNTATLNVTVYGRK